MGGAGKEIPRGRMVDGDRLRMSRGVTDEITLRQAA
jgi:hypothetical protein